MRATVVTSVVCAALGACAVQRAGLGDGDGGTDLGAMHSDLGTPVDGGLDAGADLGDTDLGAPDLGVDTGPLPCDPLACDGRRCLPDDSCGFWPSCAEVHLADPDPRTTPTGVYPIDPDGMGGMGSFDAFCEMEGDGGGWTLVLKVDPGSAAFRYAAGAWEDDSTVSPDSLDYSLTEAKLRAFRSVAVHQLRVGFLAVTDAGDGSDANYGVFDAPDKVSFKQLMMMGGAPVGVDTSWLGLIAGSSVQVTRRTTGASLDGELRLGLLGNDMSSASNPDSYLGIGPKEADFSSSTTTAPTSGNWSRFSAEGDRNLPAWGFVFVR